MNKITQQAIDELQAESDGLKATIYMPTHRHPTPPHINEDQLRYKNLINQIRNQADDSNAEAIYRQLATKLDDLEFWKQASEGLAIFADQSDVRVYHLPIECDERVVLGDSYDVAPVMTLASRDRNFYLLAVAMHDPKLFCGDMYELSPIDIELPHSVEDALNIDEMFANSRTVRSQDGPGGAKGAIGPHGEGDSRGAGSDERLRYFRIIDQAIQSMKAYRPDLPILVAGTDNEAGDYRSHSQLSGLIDGYLQGNHTKTSLHELHSLAWSRIAQELIDNDGRQWADRYRELLGKGRATTDPAEILQACRQGRVDTLLVDLIDLSGDTVSDSYEPSHKIIFDDDYERQSLDRLVLEVCRQGGRVLNLGRKLMPGTSRLAAIYRY